MTIGPVARSLAFDGRLFCDDVLDLLVTSLSLELALEVMDLVHV